MASPLIMVDGINSDVEAIRERYPHNPVACYADGDFAWTPAQQGLFARKIRISVDAGRPEEGAHARCLDVERGAARPVDVKPFIEYRKKTDTTIYCAASSVKQITTAVGNADLIPRWWIAWWWQRPGTPTREQVAATVRAETGVDLPLDRIWACQYANFSKWDLSVVYGKQDFAH